MGRGAAEPPPHPPAVGGWFQPPIPHPPSADPPPGGFTAGLGAVAGALGITLCGAGGAVSTVGAVTVTVSMVVVTSVVAGRPLPPRRSRVMDVGWGLSESKKTWWLEDCKAATIFGPSRSRYLCLIGFFQLR